MDTGIRAPLAIGSDEYREIAFLVNDRGIRFVHLRDGRPIDGPGLPLGTATVVATTPVGRGPFALGLSDGRVLPVEVRFTATHAEGRRRIVPEVVAGEPIPLDTGGRAIRRLVYAVTKDGPVVAVQIGPRDVVLASIRERRALIGPSTREGIQQGLAMPVDGEITGLALDGRGEELFVGTSRGQLLDVNLREPTAPKPGVPVAATSSAAIGISGLGFVLGDRTLVVGDAAGTVSAWRTVQAEGGNAHLRQIHDFQGHAGPVVAVEASRREKSFLTVDTQGTARLHYATSGETLLRLNVPAQAAAAAFTPKADGLLVTDGAGRLAQWEILNPHPEATLRTLFGRVWYEGYPGPEFVWQSTGATDDFESKLSLIPLVFGTLKGTCYALLFAVPIALLAALYASQFMHPTLKGVVKPTVEIMAALPSVVLGFLAGLWMAPQIERVVPGIFLSLLVIPLIIFGAVFGWRLVPTPISHRVKPGTEVGLLVPIVLFGSWLSFALGGVVEQSWLQGDYRHWILAVLGLTYDQRNSLVVGIAMGFAVIPIIFTIAEDSLSNVPQHLVAGSLALGATRWQTALRVVLPTASPGIFSAIMIGFGRAVGETMIVLMATGNTPVMNWNAFSGFRALSANIAVELPEAPAGGTLFRVLFLAALLLFGMTFAVNTVAELVRLRLRRKYRSL
jgi:phosphate transport system permease protein